MNKQVLLLASKMLDVAANEFCNHGCNDLGKDVKELIIDEAELCKDIREWNGDPRETWPETADFIGDSSLMSYLSDKLKIEAQDYE